MKLFWLKHKRVLLIVIAIVFLVALFYIKNGTSFQKSQNSQEINSDGLNYTNESIGDLVDRDTDGDSILDWEEELWGTDPTKKDSDADGTPDGTEITQLRETTNTPGAAIGGAATKDQTKTSQFSQELITTLISLNQNGALDATTAEQIGTSLSENIQTQTQNKVYTTADLKITSDNSAEAIKKYYQNRDAIYKKYHTDQTIIGVLQEYTKDEENKALLLKFDIIVTQKTKIIAELVKLQVPKSLTSLHLELINISQRILENAMNLKYLESDPLKAISAMTQYEQNFSELITLAEQMTETINTLLNN